MKTIFSILNKKVLFALFAVGALVSSCETTELELLDDPNNVAPSNANSIFLFNAVQLNFNGVIGGLNGRDMNYTRITQQFGEYFFDPAGLNGTWSTAYAGLFEDVNALVSLAQEQNFNAHAGAAQVMQAYTLVMLVDHFGDIPFSQANDVSNPNPSLDNGENVYAAALEILDDAISNLNNGDSPDIQDDLYFGSNSRDQWIKVANTLKFKMLLQTSDFNQAASITGINAILNQDLIETSGDDFQFNYLSEITPPNDNRHPSFLANYNNGTGQFMSNSYMLELIDSNDPRLRYYFYRQRLTDPPAGSLPCIDLGLDLCFIGDGYFGRDHGDNSFTTNAMFTQNATWGAYPAGGSFDDDSAQVTNNDQGGLGEGIRPIMLSSFVNFMKAEAALTLGTNGNARNFLELGIRQSIAKVLPFGDLNNNSDAGFEPSTGDIDAFVNTTLAAYDAGSDNQKLDIILTQYFVALWGNGIEAYNIYRRTGLPSFLQGTQSNIPVGQFPRVLQYPTNTVTLNSSINQQPVTNQVFWDVNPGNFVD